jgi:O-antigen/teichoic acid export membrane protein
MTLFTKFCDMLSFPILSLLQFFSEVLVLLILPAQLVGAHLDLQALCAYFICNFVNDAVSTLNYTE